VLAALDRAGAPAAFFVNGYRLAGRSPAAERQRELLVEELARGYAIGNHTWDHARLSDLPPDRQAREIVDGEAAIARVTGERPYLFRPPYGRMAPPAARTLHDRRYAVVLWNVSSEDPYLRTPDKVLDRVLAEIRREGGGVALFHDTHPWTAAALPRLFAALDEENCRRVRAGAPPLLLVPLDRLLRVRYGADEPNGGTDSDNEEDRRARRRIVERCGAGRSEAQGQDRGTEEEVTK
jgi:peptidoglycan/xylan/chitin deacetylase (PgdA/CDA1 family)